MTERTIVMSDWESQTQDYLDDHPKTSAGIALILVGCVAYGMFKAGYAIEKGVLRAVKDIKFWNTMRKTN